jgi:cellulose synthase/poly-beta-1,6-N-acetylglucosamine synthase-like glycosyltransferase
MKISFIIPAYNEEVLLGTCIDSVIAAIKENACDAEIIVVNNASTDDTRSIANSYAEVIVVDEPQKGLVLARKAGYAASSGDILANLDADTIVPKKWLPKVLHEFNSDPKLLALSGPYIYYDSSILIRISNTLFYTLGFLIDTVNQFFFKSGSILQGGNFIVRREALEKIGGFDTSIEFYGEDIDIGRRVRKIGKVTWTFSLPMYSSGRRYIKQGLIKTGILYSLNFLWITFFKKPFSKTYLDIRLKR